MRHLPVKKHQIQQKANVSGSTVYRSEHSTLMQFPGKKTNAKFNEKRKFLLNSHDLLNVHDWLFQLSIGLQSTLLNLTSYNLLPPPTLFYVIP